MNRHIFGAILTFPMAVGIATAALTGGCTTGGTSQEPPAASIPQTGPAGKVASQSAGPASSEVVEPQGAITLKDAVAYGRIGSIEALGCLQ